MEHDVHLHSDLHPADGGSRRSSMCDQPHGHECVPTLRPGQRRASPGKADRLREEPVQRSIPRPAFKDGTQLLFEEELTLSQIHNEPVT